MTVVPDPRVDPHKIVAFYVEHDLVFTSEFSWDTVLMHPLMAHYLIEDPDGVACGYWERRNGETDSDALYKLGKEYTDRTTEWMMKTYESEYCSAYIAGIKVLALAPVDPKRVRTHHREAIRSYEGYEDAMILMKQLMPRALEYCGELVVQRRTETLAVIEQLQKEGKLPRDILPVERQMVNDLLKAMGIENVMGLEEPPASKPEPSEEAHVEPDGGLDY